jgi:hypothetical protein
MNRNGSKKTARRVRVWSYDEAKKAVPYISGIMRSLREHCLESQSHKRTAQRLADKPGRPDRAALVAHGEEVRQATEAQNRFDDGIAELHALDVFCLDPITGEAVIPFLHAKKLAWFVFGAARSGRFLPRPDHRRGRDSLPARQETGLVRVRSVRRRRPSPAVALPRRPARHPPPDRRRSDGANADGVTFAIRPTKKRACGAGPQALSCYVDRARRAIAMFSV